MELVALTKHGSSVSGLLPLSNGRLLSWSKSSSTLRVWNSAGDLLHDLETHREVDGARELRDGRLVSWSQDRKIRLWSGDGDLLRTTEKHHGYISQVLELCDGRLLSWAKDHKPRLWTSDGDPLRIMKAHGGQVWRVTELRDGRLLSAASHSWPRLWSSSGDLLRELKHLPHTFKFQLRDGRFACWLNASELQFLNIEDDKVVYPIRSNIPMTRSAIELRDGRLLSWARDIIMTSSNRDGTTQHTYEQDNSLRLWNADGTLLCRLEGHTNNVLGALELKDGRLLSWSDDGTLRLWSADGTPLRALDKHTAEVTGALELSSGRFLVAR